MDNAFSGDTFNEAVSKREDFLRAYRADLVREVQTHITDAARGHAREYNMHQTIRKIADVDYILKNGIHSIDVST